MSVRELESSPHCRHLILYHLVFCAKYRNKIFSNKAFGESLKSKMVEISYRYDFSIDTIDLDYSKPDHIHLMVRSIPSLAPCQIARVLKQESNIWAWKNYSEWLTMFYWEKHSLFTRGYFCGSIGNVSADVVHEYLEKQGMNL